MSGKQQRRERAREERLRQEADVAAAQRRRRTLQYGAAAVFVAVLAVVALIVISQSGSDDSGGDSTIEHADKVNGMLEGVPQDQTTLGDASAKVMVTEYGDLQCPVCKEFSEQVIPTLISDQVEPGDIQLTFRTFDIIGPQSEDASEAALAAAKQGRYWNFVELFYANQGTENSGYVTDDFLRSIAEGAGVPDLDQWESDRHSDEVVSQLQSVQNDAASLGLHATPSVVVEGPGGSKTLVAPTLEQVQQTIGEVS